MATTVTRLTSTGTLLVNGTFDEVNGPIVTNGLQLWLEAANPNSYSGTGTTWTDLSGNGNNGTLNNGVGFDSFNGGLVFDGSNDYVDLNTNNIITGTNPFTFSCFYTITAFNSGGEIFGNYGVGSTTDYLWISGEYGVYLNGSVYFPGPLGPGTYHMAVTRDSAGLVILYKNGVQVNSGTLASSILANKNFRIGADVTSSGVVGGELLNGKIYQQLVYNRALTADEITQNYNARRQVFALEATSSTTVVGKISMNTNTVFASVFDEVSLAAGSVSFNGTSAYLSVPYSSNFEFGNGDFTVECWMYSAGVNLQGLMAFPHNAGNYAQVLIYGASASSLALYSSSNGTSWDVSSGISIGTINLNAWNHVAVSKSGSSIRLFMNGILQNTVIFAGTFAGTYDRCWIGDTSGNPNYSGLLSNVRVVKGTAVYTANFTPPQTVLDVVSTTSLLLNVLTSEDFIKDNSPNNFTITNTGGATFSSTGAFNQGNFTVKQRQLYDGKLAVSGMFDEGVGGVAYVTTGTFSWTAPAHVTSISVLAVGAGGSGGGYGGGGGALAYKNNVTVTPGQTYSLTVGWPNPYNSEGSATSSTFGLSVPLVANGGRGGNTGGANGSVGIGQGYDGGGGGGAGGGDYFDAIVGYQSGGSGGAGGYTASGGAGSVYPGTGAAGTGGSGGGGGYPNTSTFTSKGGGGVGIYGLGSNGSATGGGGSGGLSQNANVGGKYGGGGPGITTPSGLGATGVVRIIWPGTTRRFPSTGDLTAINETTI